MPAEHSSQANAGRSTRAEEPAAEPATRAVRLLDGRAEMLRRWGIAAWVAAIAGFAALHAWHLRADFPNGSPWILDWAKYTDEGWYGAAAVRAHLFGHWYFTGDFNTAVAVPAWPFVEWVAFFITGVKIEAARGLAVGCFFTSLGLLYLLLRRSGSRAGRADDTRFAGTLRWPALLAVTLAVTSPFLYSFSRLAILEPLETTLTLAMLNVAVRLPRMKRPMLGAIAVGILFALAMLTKTNAVFLAPAAIWAVAAPLWSKRKLALRCVLAAGLATTVVYGAWIAVIARAGLMGDYRFFFLSANAYAKPPEIWWPQVAFWWSLHGLLWIDHSMVVLAGALTAGAALAWRTQWGRIMWREPVFGAAILGILGFVLFMTVQDHPQPRYFMVPAFLVCALVALGAETLVERAGWAGRLGWLAVAAAVVAAGVHGAKTNAYARHPEYTWVNAATQVTQYIDTHPNGKRLVVATSGDEIMLMTGLPAICDELSTDDLADKVSRYQPGWFATWNEVDPSTLADLHTRYSLEQVASFSALDDPDRDVLVLFKLHPLPGGRVRSESEPGMSDVLPEDRIEATVEE
ncbi:MAG TPA: hypothetical protein VMT38_00270 [Terracidiphilus sp.]|nr:hypothetical protein [Terracidiphilus sp.]